MEPPKNETCGGWLTSCLLIGARNSRAAALVVG